jgi:hypothetical protein
MLSRGMSSHRWCFGKRTNAPFRGMFSLPLVFNLKIGQKKILAAHLVGQKTQFFLPPIVMSLYYSVRKEGSRPLGLIV